MEKGKQSGSSALSSSSLFGAKDSSSSSSSPILTSIFDQPPQPQVGSGESLNLCRNEKKKGVAKTPVPGEEEKKSWCFAEEKVEPFHYSSSIYYGGQDVYSQPHTAPNPTTTFNKDVGEDDSDSASRGNWWQGSLYY